MAETPPAPNSTVPEPPQPGRGPEPSLPGREGERGLPAPDWPRPGGQGGWGGGPGGFGVPGEGPRPHTPGREPGGYPGGDGRGNAPGDGGGRGYEPPAGGTGAGNGSGGGAGDLPSPGGGAGRDGERAGYGADPGGFNPLPHMPKRGQDGNGNGEDDELPEAPAAVRTAWFLYILAAVFSVVSPLTAFLPGGRSTSVEAVRDALGGNQQQYSDEQIGAASTLVDVVAVVLVAAIAIAFLLVARRLFRGKQWARALLTAGTVVLVARGLAALFTLLAGGPGPDVQFYAEPVPNFVDLAATVLAGLFGGVALWQLYTKESNTFFLENSGVGTKL